MGAPMVKLRKISGLAFAGLLMASTVVPVVSASVVSDLFAQYPDGGDDFEDALNSAFDSDPDGTALAIALAYASASPGQQAAAQAAVGNGCTGSTSDDQSVRDALAGLSGFNLGSCNYNDTGGLSPFRRTTTGTSNGSGFGGGSISPNSQQDEPDDDIPS